MSYNTTTKAITLIIVGICFSTYIHYTRSPSISMCWRSWQSILHRMPFYGCHAYKDGPNRFIDFHGYPTDHTPEYYKGYDDEDRDFV
jgi:hypothetical protein